MPRPGTPRFPKPTTAHDIRTQKEHRDTPHPKSKKPIFSIGGSHTDHKKLFRQYMHIIKTTEGQKRIGNQKYIYLTIGFGDKDTAKTNAASIIAYFTHQDAVNSTPFKDKDGNTIVLWRTPAPAIINSKQMDAALKTRITLTNTTITFSTTIQDTIAYVAPFTDLC